MYLASRYFAPGQWPKPADLRYQPSGFFSPAYFFPRGEGPAEVLRYADLHRLCLRIAGKIEREDGTYVYQRTGRGYGNLEQPGRWDLQLRRHVVPTDYRTEAQLACRARLRNATLAWQQLGENDKQHWRNLATHKRLTGFNLFVRDYCRAHPL